MPHYRVSIAGNIAAGKTTLTRLLAERLGWCAYYEQVLDNPYLPSFYADMARWSFHLQVYFFTHRFRTFQDMLAQDNSCVQDRTIYEDLEIFARTLNQQGFLDDRDYQNYRVLFETLIESLPRPDLIVYLQAPPEFLLERIRQRGRGFEQGISLDYLRGLEVAYEDWLQRAADSLPFLSIDAASYDAACEQEVERVLRLIVDQCERS
ncbi:MAG: deoxynucleoside kinase [Chloroflexia bacterium]|nr:deoxynucleoside kinase [Chloroflexia bacterium]